MKTLTKERPIEGVCVTTGDAKDGEILLHDKRRFQQMLAQVPNGPVVVRIEPAHETRSLEANRRYFAVLRQIVDTLHQAGVDVFSFYGRDNVPVTSESLHDFFKARYNHRSTTALSDREFAAYVEQVMAYAAQEWAVEFPEPEPMLRIDR